MSEQRLNLEQVEELRAMVFGVGASASYEEAVSDFSAASQTADALFDVSCDGSMYQREIMLNQQAAMRESVKVRETSKKLAYLLGYAAGLTQEEIKQNLESVS